jgi:hypothetical protein
MVSLVVVGSLRKEEKMRERERFMSGSVLLELNGF